MSMTNMKDLDISNTAIVIIMTTTSTSRRRSARKGEREARRRLEVAWLPSLKEFIVIRIHAMITIQMMLGFFH